MRKTFLIIIIAAMVAAIVLSSIVFVNNAAKATAPASGSDIKGSVVVWNKEKDQKLFETSDDSAVSKVYTFIKTAKWSNVNAEPTGSDVKNVYNLTIYDQNGKGEQYSMLYMNNNTIALFYQKANQDGTYLQASFPIEAGGLNDTIKINPTAPASSVPASASAAASASASAS